MGDREFVFDLSELQAGSPLRFDIKQRNGQLLARSGDIVTREMLACWAQQGITTGIAILVHEAESEPAVDETPDDEAPKVSPDADTVSADTIFSEEAELLRPYDEAALRRLEENFESASTAMLDMARLLATDALTDCDSAVESLEGFLVEIELDLATVLASVHPLDTEVQSDKDVAIARRSAKMAVLAMVISSNLGYSREDCQMVGLAGMLHDISLFDQVQDAVREICGVHPDPVLHYQDHPLNSASLLTYVHGVSDQTRHVITQPHEEPRGTGFPRGLESQRIHRLAKVLHLVDAYLTLTLTSQPPPLSPAANLVPADAIAYLMYHAQQGNFDVVSVRGLVEATSLYPVGSQVELSDQSVATVLRSSGADPSEPIVRLDRGSRSIIDLRHSQLSILHPFHPGAETSRQRISSSKLTRVLWRAEVA